MNGVLVSFILLFGLNLAMVGCSGEDATDVQKRLTPPAGGKDAKGATEDKNFSGRWVSQCNEENQQGFRSYRVEMDFADDQLVMTTRFYIEDECYAENMRIETAGTFKTTNGDSRDNMVEFTEGGNNPQFFRVAGPDDAFIITKLKSSADEANKTVADISMYRDDKWEMIQQTLLESTPESLTQLEEGVYQSVSNNLCQFVIGLGKPTEKWQVLYVDLRSPDCGSDLIKFTCFGAGSECRAQGNTDYRLEQVSETEFRFRLAFQSQYWSYEKIEN